MSDRTPGIRPRPSFARRLDVAARMALPASSTALLLLIGGAPWHVPGQPLLQLAAGQVAIFFWSLFRPVAMPPVAVFLLGLLADLLQFSPPGVNTVLMLATQGIAVRWRRDLVRRGFLVIWLAFAGAAAVTAVLGWGLASVLALRLLPLDAALLQAGLAAGLYPALALLLARLHETLAEPGRA